MVSYYNPSAMYRHQQAVAGNPSGPFQANSPMHTWYTAAGYHQSGPMSGGHPGTYCGMQDEQQIWHHHSHQHAAAAAMFHNDYQDLVHGGGGGGGTVPMQSQHLQQMDTENHLPSPPITLSGSEMSSPGAGSGNISPPNNTNGQNTRPAPVRSPYEWIKKTSYQSQPNPEQECLNSHPVLLDYPAQECHGKTRTKDKYRVVYTDHQRVELEKEFYYSRYITIRRKAELATNLGLSERQVKIWFQNRRAKERKQVKKRDNSVYPKNTENNYNFDHHHHQMAEHIIQSSEIIQLQNHHQSQHLLPDNSDVLASEIM